MSHCFFAGSCAVALALGSMTPALAQLPPQRMASGPMYGGSTQNSIDCYVVNIGNKPVAISRTLLIGQEIGVVASHNNCGSTLAPGAVCTFGVAISGGANACAIEADSVRDLRGSAQIRHTEPNGGAANTLVDEVMH